MDRFVYNIPSEFTDEDKYFKFFTKKDLAVIIITGAFTFLLFKIAGHFGRPLVGLIIGIIIMILSIGCSMIKKPSSEYLTGGGQVIMILILRRLIRRKKKVIYIKGYDDLED